MLLQPYPRFLMLPQPYPLFLMLLQPHPVYSLYSYNLILHYCVTNHPLFLLWLQPHPQHFFFILLQHKCIFFLFAKSSYSITLCCHNIILYYPLLIQPRPLLLFLLQNNVILYYSLLLLPYHLFLAVL